MRYDKKTDGTLTPASEDTSTLNKFLSTPFKILAGDKDQALSNDEARAGALTLAAAAFIGGGFWARKRAEAGQSAYLGFLL